MKAPIEEAQKSRLGWWYATGPADKPFSINDPDFNIHRVVGDTCATPGCVLIENGGGQRFPLSRELLEDVGAPDGHIWDKSSKTFVRI